MKRVQIVYISSLVIELMLVLAMLFGDTYLLLEATVIGAYLNIPNLVFDLMPIY